jgi:hypothetical protein
MATRCCVKIEGTKIAKLYKHWDGGPDSTLPWLEDFNKDFAKYRGVDADYKFAQLVRSSIRDAEEYGLDSSKHTGWGIVDYNDNCGAEYEYTLLENGEVECVEV